MVPFAGWEMPVQYAGILDEVRPVRTKAGLLDLGLMRTPAKSSPGVNVVDQTDTLGMIAIQGPASQTIVQRLCPDDLASLKYYAWMRTKVDGVDLELSRTGYTGEDGFEFYV